MDERWWSRIEMLFGALLDHPATERDAMLTELCGGDTGLLAEVRSLLEADARSGALLPEPQPPESDLPPGRLLGPYRVVRLLGRGGTGAVYLAERADDAFRRAVAIKVVSEADAPGYAVARFLAERRILAALDHPNIVRLLDAGRSADGLLYLVMEYVEGEPIDRSCDRHHLEIAERVRLARAVCDAVHAVHQVLVVHRDIKPGNILVTAAGVPRLIDFGIAKPLPAAAGLLAHLSTLTGLRPMTPEYASPEQVLGLQVGRASDVYALGVLLYRLLTGRSPYQPEGPGVGALERAICEQEPERPSSVVRSDPHPEVPARARGTTPSGLRRRLSGDLDAIVLKALRKEPERRYGSAGELSDDLGRHLRGRPVRARRGSVVYRAHKLFQRHRLAAAVAVAALVVLLGLAVAMTVLSARLTVERDRAAAERDKAQRVAVFLGEIFQLADPATSLGEAVTAQEILDRGVERIPIELDGRPDLQAELLHAIGRIYADLGLYEQGRELVDRALETRRSVLGPDHPLVAESMDQLGSIRFMEGDYAASERLHRQAIELLRRTAGSDDLRVAEAMQSLGAAVRRQNRLDEAERLYRDALEIFRRAGAEEHPEAARTLSNLAVLLHSRGDLAAAERLHRQTLELRRRQLGPGHPDVARSLSYLGITLREQGAYDTAEPLLRQALELHTRLWGGDHPEVAWAHHDLALLLRDRGDLTGAEEHLQRALEIQRRRLGENHSDFALTTSDLAFVRMERGDLAEAQALFTAALEIYRRTLGSEHPHVAVTLMNLGRVAGRGGDHQLAESRYRQALDILGRAPGAERIEGNAALRLGTLLLETGMAAAAEPELRRAVAAFGHSPVTGAGVRAWAENTLGACLTALGRYQEAEDLLLASYPALARGGATERERQAEAARRLTTLYRAWGRSGDAARWEARRAALTEAEV